MSILLYFLIIATVVVSIFRPWIGVLAYYTMAIFQPQSIWWWTFGDIRVSFFVSLAVFAGFAVAVVMKKVSFDVFRDPVTRAVLGLWFFLLGSYYLSPYTLNTSADISVNSEYLIGVSNKIFLFFVISLTLINHPTELKYFAFVIVISVAYHTYWANDRYFSGLMFGPRLGGPVPINGGGMYGDENAYAVLFVTGCAFLFYMIKTFQFKILQYAILPVIFFSWHAVFLTGSRGGLLALAGACIAVGYRMKSKILGIGILVALVAAFVWQGGNMMKERSETMGRIEAWEAALKMMQKHPVFGVGIGNFLKAYPLFSGNQPRVTHNTFFQLAAESGVLAGLLYLFMSLYPIYYGLKGRGHELSQNQTLNLVRDSITAGMCGFFISALFLNLATYEILYYLIALHICCARLEMLDAQGVFYDEYENYEAEANPQQQKYSELDYSGY